MAENTEGTTYKKTGQLILSGLGLIIRDAVDYQPARAPVALKVLARH